jgi:hypothetical protein
LKTELIYPHGRYPTRREAEHDIQEYIEVFYNRQRIQKWLGYLSPAMFEQKFLSEINIVKRFGFQTIDDLPQSVHRFFLYPKNVAIIIFH